MLVNNSAASLKELQRMSGSPQGTSTPIIVPIPPTGANNSSQGASMNFANNRSGYASSVYTL